MLDCKVTLFQLPMPNTRVEQDKAQIISGCNAYLGQAFLSAHGIYSELEQDSCAYLNCNDYNGKAIEIESEQNRCAMAYQCCGAVFLLLQK